MIIFLNCPVPFLNYEFFNSLWVLKLVFKKFFVSNLNVVNADLVWMTHFHQSLVPWLHNSLVPGLFMKLIAWLINICLSDSLIIFGIIEVKFGVIARMLAEVNVSDSIAVRRFWLFANSIHHSHSNHYWKQYHCSNLNTVQYQLNKSRHQFLTILL